MPQTKVQNLTGQPIPEATVSFFDLKGPVNLRELTFTRDVANKDDVTPWRTWDNLPPEMRVNYPSLNLEETPIITEAETSDNS